MEEDEKLLRDTPNNTSEQQYLSRPRQWAMIVIILSMMLLSMAVDTMIFPFFPAIAVEKGLSNAEIGFVFSSFDLTKFLVSPIFGSLLVKWHPKNMLAFGNMLTALACIGFGAIDIVEESEIFLGLCILIRLIAGVGSAMLTVSGSSILMKSTSYEPSTIAGIIESTIGLGFVTGAALAAVLYDLVGYTPMFWIFGGVMFGFIPVFLLLVPKVVEVEVNRRKGFLSLLSIPGCLLVFIHCAMIKFNTTARSTELTEFMASAFGTSPSTVGLLLAVSAILQTIASAVATKLIDKRYLFHTMITGWCITIVIILFFCPSPLLDFIFHGQRYFWLTAVMSLTTNLFLPMLYIPPYQASLSLTEVNGYEKDSLHTYGMVAGLVNSGISFGSTVGPVVAGAITDSLDFPWTLTIFDFVNILLVILMATYLGFMKLTNQPLYAEDINGTEDIDGTEDINGTEDNNGTEDSKQAQQTVGIEQKINDACTNRMNQCLNNSKPLTKIHHQQPVNR